MIEEEFGDVVVGRHITRGTDAGVVDHDVRRAEVLDDSIHRSIDLRGVRDVADRAEELGWHSGHVSVQHGDPRTAHGEQRRDGPADPLPTLVDAIPAIRETIARRLGATALR